MTGKREDEQDDEHPDGPMGIGLKNPHVGREQPTPQYDHLKNPVLSETIAEAVIARLLGQFAATLESEGARYLGYGNPAQRVTLGILASTSRRTAVDNPTPEGLAQYIARVHAIGANLRTQERARHDDADALALTADNFEQHARRLLGGAYVQCGTPVAFAPAVIPDVSAGSSQVAPEGAREAVVRRVARRDDAITLVIDRIYSEAPEPKDRNAMWMSLIELAGQSTPRPPLIEFVEGEVKYQDSSASGGIGFLSRKLFLQRIGRWTAKDR